MVETAKPGIDLESVWARNYPPGVSRTLEIPNKTVYQMLVDAVAKNPGAVAMNLFGKKVTYGNFLTMVDALAFNLKERLRLFKGSKVGFILPNSPQYVISFFAVAKIGGVIVQTNPIYTESEIHDQYMNSEASAVIVLDIYYPKVKALVAKDISIVVTKLNDFLGFFASRVYNRRKKKNNEIVNPDYGGRVFRFMDMLKGGSSPEERINVAEDPVLFQYTGGTTGTPKGAMLSHRNLAANVTQITSWHKPFSQPSITMSVLPFFHVYGMMTSMMLPVATGGTMVLVPDPRDTEMLLKLVNKNKPRYLPGVPTLYKSMILRPDFKKYNMRSIEVCVSGGAPLPIDTLRRFEEASGGLLIEGYGLSETSPVVATNPIDKDKRRAGSVGLPVPNTNFRIVNAYSMDDVPQGEEGELLISGPQVMLGYWRNDAETREVLVNGWLRTGDIGKMDSSGYLYLVDRKKDMIISSGYNVYPREIEEVFYRHPDIIEAAAIGVPDPKRGQSIKVYVVKKEGSAVSEQELIDFASKHLAPYKRPVSVEFKKDLPRTLVGKVLRRELRQDRTQALRPDRNM